MKIFFLLISTFALNKANAQSKEFIDFIGKRIELHLVSIPPLNQYDSCYYLSTLLKIEIDKNYKIISILFSDNAKEWLVNDLERAKEFMATDIKKMEAYAKKEKIKETGLIFPFISKSVFYPCGKASINSIMEKRYFTFKGEPLKGNIIFCDVLGMSFYKPNR